MATDNLPMLPDPDDAAGILNKLRLEMESRQEESSRLRGDPATKDMPLIVWVEEEVSQFTRSSCAHPPSETVMETLQKLLRAGRATGPYYLETNYLCDTCSAVLYTPLHEGETEPTEAMCVKCGFSAPWEQVQRSARVKIPPQKFSRDLMTEMPESMVRAGERLLPGLRMRSADGSSRGETGR